MQISYRINPPISSATLNALFSAAWDNHQSRDFEAIHSHSLVYICAYAQKRLVGYVNVAWDGGIHAFLLDTTVHPSARRSGIGTELILHAAAAARQRGIVWLHVDFEAKDAEFYRRCGFTPAEAGLMRLRE